MLDNFWGTCLLVTSLEYVPRYTSASAYFLLFAIRKIFRPSGDFGPKTTQNFFRPSGEFVTKSASILK